VLAVGGSGQPLSVEVAACADSVPPERCSGEYPFSAEGPAPEGTGTFRFIAHRGTDCLEASGYYFVAQVTLERDGTIIGPFVSEPTRTSLLAPTAETLSVGPRELVFNAFGKQSPPMETLTIRSRCGGPLDWTVAASEPWLQVSPTTAASATDRTEVLVGIDATNLDPGQGPFTATLTITSTSGGSVTVPVVLNLAC
jgi:hypothetical protein